MEQEILKTKSLESEGGSSVVPGDVFACVLGSGSEAQLVWLIKNFETEMPEETESLYEDRQVDVWCAA